jgi:hypothetical protein
MEVDLIALTKKTDEMREEIFTGMVDTFRGVRAVVDHELKGAEFYICVSKELAAQMEREAEATT